MTVPLVTVIILAYKQPAFLNAALASVAAQTHPHIEILIVDDASGKEFTRQYDLSANARMMVNAERVAFAAVSRNRAWREARGEYIAFLDQDDVWEPRKLALQVAAMQAQRRAIMHYTHYSRVDPELRPLATQNPFGGAHGDTLRHFIHRRPPYIVCCSSVMLRRNACESVGSFDETIRLSADWDMWIRCAAHGTDAVLSDARPLVLYREHPAQWSASEDKNAMAAFSVMEKAVRWVTVKRPDLRRLIQHRRAELLREAAHARLRSEPLFQGTIHPSSDIGEDQSVPPDDLSIAVAGTSRRTIVRGVTVAGASLCSGHA